MNRTVATSLAESAFGRKTTLRGRSGKAFRPAPWVTPLGAYYPVCGRKVNKKLFAMPDWRTWANSGQMGIISVH
jgi:hypothetical protein